VLRSMSGRNRKEKQGVEKTTHEGLHILYTRKQIESSSAGECDVRGILGSRTEFESEDTTLKT
jgi:hypothetical protein